MEGRDGEEEGKEERKRDEREVRIHSTYLHHDNPELGSSHSACLRHG